MSDTLTDNVPPSADEQTEAETGKGNAGRPGANWLVRLAVLLIVIIWVVPTLGLLIDSIRTRALVESTGWWTLLTNPFDVSQYTLSHYRDVLGGRGFGTAFANSLAVSIPATVIPITMAAFASYAWSWMEFKGRQISFVAVVGLLVVPLQMALIPLLRLYVRYDLVGSFPAVWLAHAGFGLPLAVYLLRNYIGSLPSSIIESAKVDGASHFEIFVRLIVPLSVPALASFAIFQFLWVWNDLLVAFVFLGASPDVQVLQQALAELRGQRGQFAYLLPAAGFVTMILPMAVFFGLQRYFVRGLTAGAVKG